MGPLGLPAPDSGSVPRCCAGTPPPAPQPPYLPTPACPWHSPWGRWRAAGRPGMHLEDTAAHPLGTVARSLAHLP